MRIQHILCPMDFSEFSRQAFNRAVAIARVQRAAITVLHVVPIQTAATILPYMAPESLGPMELPQVDHGRIAREMTSFLHIDGTLGIPVICEVSEAPDVHHEILVHANRLPADIIVMGTHGRSGFQRIVLGSVTEKILRKSSVPVVTVPATTATESPAGGAVPFSRILCAIDFSQCSLEGLKYAMALAAETGARLTLAHVIELAPPIYDPLVGPPIDLPGYQAAAEVLSRNRLRDLIPAPYRAATVVEEAVLTGKPHREIVRLAEEWEADLIVLGIHGRNVVDRLLFGSTVEPVVRRAPCPVMTVRVADHRGSFDESRIHDESRISGDLQRVADQRGSSTSRG